MFETCQSAQTADLFPPLCVKFSCRATARLQKFALPGKESLAAGRSVIYQTRHRKDGRSLMPGNMFSRQPVRAAPPALLPLSMALTMHSIFLFQSKEPAWQKKNGCFASIIWHGSEMEACGQNFRRAFTALAAEAVPPAFGSETFITGPLYPLKISVLRY
ncbi:MAG: hypothetical protein OSJ58_12065 [Dysosmobacter sp.]|nr:hypothetical protein [Dysosmobacter sp.]